MTVQRYGVGDYFNFHYDHLRPDVPHHYALLERSDWHCRVGTCLLYLDEPEDGGATLFANLGLRIFPKRGSLLYFAIHKMAMKPVRCMRERRY